MCTKGAQKQKVKKCEQLMDKGKRNVDKVSTGGGQKVHKS